VQNGHVLEDGSSIVGNDYFSVSCLDLRCGKYEPFAENPDVVPINLPSCPFPWDPRMFERHPLRLEEEIKRV
jgi:hypothetical protein